MKRENTTAEVKYLYVPFNAVSDSAVQVSDQELTTYIKDHPKEFEVEAGRSLQYVAFPIVPSEQDMAEFEEELAELKEELASATNDSTFAAINTDGNAAEAFRRYQTGDLPPTLAENIDSLSEGSVFGPITEGDVYRLYKVAESGRRYGCLRTSPPHSASDRGQRPTRGT